MLSFRKLELTKWPPKKCVNNVSFRKFKYEGNNS